MRKFTKITLITALVMLVTGGILTAGGILFGASPKAFQDGLEKGARNHSVFNRWLENNWLERLTDWEDYWEEKGEDWVIDWRKETGIRNMDWSDTSQKASIDAEKVKSLYVAAEAGKIRIQSSPDEKIWVSGMESNLYTADMDSDTGILSISRSKLADGGKALLVQIPQNKIFEKLSLSSEAGSLKAEGKLTARTCDVDVEAGNLDVELLEAEDSALRCEAGQLSIKYAGSLNEYMADVNVDSGVLDLDGESMKGFHEGDFGNLSSDKTLEIENSAGNMIVEFENK